MFHSTSNSNSSFSLISAQDVETNVDSLSESSRSLDNTVPSTRHGKSSRNQFEPPSNSSSTQLTQRTSPLNEDEQPTSSSAAALTAITATSPTPPPQDNRPVTWSSLPKKGQLAIITLARLSEPLAERSLAAYMFYQLRSFDPSLPDSTITSQGGMLTAAFAGAQFLTAVWWGRAADTPWIGRKRVLLVGLSGTALASIGVGFSKNFVQALCFRALAGALNGNIGVMRTMISEMIQEKKYQTRAFLLLPMCFNIGVVIGPIMGGFLADPIKSFPTLFGVGSLFGGQDGVGWMKTFPYGFPNLFSGFFIMMSAIGVVLGLDETHEALKNKPDYGRKVGRWLVRIICRRGREKHAYTQLSENDLELEDTSTSIAVEPQSALELERKADSASSSDLDDDVEQHSSKLTSSAPPPKPKSGILRILTPNILLILLAHHLMALHISAFNALIFLFLPSPRASNPHTFTLKFTGGLGLSSSHVGLATAIMGIIGLPFQLLVYPSLQAKLGTLPGYRMFLPFSVLAYVTLPFLAILPDRAYVIWPALAMVLAAQVLSRTFATTSTVVLVNNSSPGPEVLGTIHGVAQSVSSAARMLGPTVGGWGLGLGLRENCVGAVWWAMAVVVGINWGLLWCVFEGDGRGGKA